MSFSVDGSDKILDLIYDAATEEELWSDVLITLADMTNSQGGVIYGLEERRDGVIFRYNGRLNDASHEAFLERHMLNPFSNYMFREPEGTTVESDQVISLGDLRKTAFFEEVLRTSDTAHAAMSALFSKGDFRVAFNLLRSERQGGFDERSLAFIASLIPHMRRSFLLKFRNSVYRPLQKAEHEILEQLAIAIILLDRSGKVVFANRSARALCESDGPLSMKGLGLTIRSRESQDDFSRLIKNAIAGTPIDNMLLPLGHGVLNVCVCSVRGKDVERLTAFNGQVVAAVVYINDPVVSGKVPAKWLMDTYGLTASEAKVALSVLSGLPTTHTARQLHLSPHTVKTHMKRVLAKTGTTGQVQLAMMLQAMGSVQPPKER